jgi:hypothetical protein
MVKPYNAWLCTQGDHNKFEANDFQGFQAVVMCYHDGCAQGWCVDCIPTERARRREPPR